ncbi:MAG: PDDEXK nuclease domain-containing protein, partial [Deltaproteobacteria bacterium]|nr:PDDEXK nuclease domain-containing protein [Deltaproteobacteria bacterium]
MSVNAMDLLATEIRAIMAAARANLSREVNKTMLDTYWQVGRIIVEREQNGELKSQHDAKLLTELSKRLSRKLGRGYSRSNLCNMRELYLQRPKIQMASGKLSWSHYLELLSVKDTDARAFYEHECENAKWSVEELKRQIGASLFERLLLSDGKANKEKALALSRKGITLSRPEDMLKEPFVCEFIGVPENKPMLEKDLEAKLIRHIEDFLLGLGRGFMFVGSQQRVTIGNTRYYVDMVFYNKILKAYVLIDLKIGELRIEHAGQMNAYLNYYKT